MHLANDSLHWIGGYYYFFLWKAHGSSEYCLWDTIHAMGNKETIKADQTFVQAAIRHFLYKVAILKTVIHINQLMNQFTLHIAILCVCCKPSSRDIASSSERWPKIKKYIL